ncbi:hypothetical protein ACO0SA_003068 [Hanseniaspora valbyensis]
MNSITTPSSIISSPTNDLTVHLMNTKVTEKDSLYHICDNLLKRLNQYQLLKPYIQSAELLAEYSAEKQEDTMNFSYLNTSNNNNKSTTPVPDSSNGSNSRPNSFLYRKSSLVESINNSKRNSVSSFHSNHISSSTTTNSSLHSQSANSSSNDLLLINNNQAINLSNISNNLQQYPTFSIGSLPPCKERDPVTTIWKFFQMGAPLCIIFNAIKPQYKINIISSDDLKICKKSIYDFISSCKVHLQFHDEELFTISDVFNNGTFTLVKIIEVILTLISYNTKIFPSLNNNNNNVQKQVEDPAILKDDRYKIFREFLETERKYVYDLETLQDFNIQLLTKNYITVNESATLFPNITDIIEFQRRFLISIENNNKLSDLNDIRLGSIFINSYNLFKLYELWSIGQTAAIDYISKLPIYNNGSNSNLIIKNKLELQSFLLKPIQRLCKYPLLLKEFYQASNANSQFYKELEIGLEVSKKIATNINEHQRKLENEVILKQLVVDRVVNWRGYDITKFGDLLSHEKVVITNNDADFVDAKIFEISLFEKIIIIFNELNANGTVIVNEEINENGNNSSSNNNSSSGLKISLKKSRSTTNHKHDSDSSTESSQYKINKQHKLDLKGRIMMSTVVSLQEHYSHPKSIDIRWESSNETGNFNLKFKNDDVKEIWSSYISLFMKSNSTKERISKRSTSISSQVSEVISNISAPTTSTSITTSSSSTPVTANKPNRLSHNLRTQKRNSKLRNISETSLLFENEHRSMSENFKSSIPPNQILVRIQQGFDFHSILIPTDINFQQFYKYVTKKLNLDANSSGNKIKLKYQDEDMDYVMLDGEDDWMIVREWLEEGNQKILTVFSF